MEVYAYKAPWMTSDEKSAIDTDPATVLAQERGQEFQLYHIPSDTLMKFKAYVEDYQDKYTTEWTSADVYGRMDPIHQYQGTKRIITFDWVLPAISRAEAAWNHQKLTLLFSMLYPHYEDVGPSGPTSATQISTAPIFKIKFGNLIHDPRFGEASGDAHEAGLVGSIDGFIYAPDFDSGFIDLMESDLGRAGASTAPEGGPGVMYPKISKLSMELTVFHTFPLGWNGKEKRTPGFPYGRETAGSENANVRSNQAGNAGDTSEADAANVDGVLS